MNHKKSFLKFISSILVLTISFTQVVWGQEYWSPEGQNLQTVKTLSESEEPLSSAAGETPVSETSQDFLEDTLSLTPAEDDESEIQEPKSEDLKEYDYERYSFQDAKELLRKEFAAAVILKELKKEDLEELVNLGFETGILVLHGEIVLFTSGSEDEIGVLSAVKSLTEKADFISHTHPTIYSKEGPSGQDINEAVEAPKEEYVLTDQGVYAYNRDGILYGGQAQTYEWYLEKIGAVLNGGKGSKNDNQVQARADLNLFIAEQDRYNQAGEEERITLRRGGTISSNATLTSGSVTDLPGNPMPYFAAGSSSSTTLSYASSLLNLGYNVTAPGSASGMSVSFDDASTSNVETQSLSGFGYLIFGLKGNNTSASLEIVDINGNKDTFTLTGISSSAEKFWPIQVSSISNLLDKTKIKQINFIVSQSDTTSSTRTGTLYIRTNGANTNSPAKPVVTSTVPAYTNQNSFIISGTKEANAAILINGNTAVARDGLTTWSAAVNLPMEGTNSIAITQKNSISKTSSAVNLSIKRDTNAPTGSINVNSGAAYSSSQAVTLNLSASDSANNLDKMSFSTDGTNWSTPEAYAASKSFTLPAEDGNKTVYVKYFDKAGNVSSVYSKSIVLDTLPPSGSVKVNNGVQYISQTGVTLNLAAVDAGMGLDKMSFSSDNVTFSTAENYSAAKGWTFSNGDNNKTVYVKFQDKTGKWSAPVSVTVLLDTVSPTGSLNINSGASMTNSREITLNLSASDSGSGMGTVSFSTDNQNWPAPEVYSTEKTFTLPEGEGAKTIYVKYFDNAGKTSPVYSKSILLDTAAPTGSLLVNNGDLYTNNREVSLTMSASDTGSGLDLVRYSADGGMSWTSWEVYAASKSLTLEVGDGDKSIKWEVRDIAGNIEQFSKVITLDTAPPSGSVLINNGEEFTPDREVSLSLTAADSSAGLDQMRFSTDGGQTWTSWEAVLNSKTVFLPEGNGVKQVKYQVRDKVGNISTYDSSITYAELTETILADGTRLFFGGNLLIKEITPAGHEISYALNGSVTKYRSSTGEEIRYLKDASNKIQRLNAEGVVIETIDRPVPPVMHESEAVRVGLENGISAYYVEGTLAELRTSSGLRMTNLTLNEEYEIQHALLVYPDGSIEIVRDGIVLRKINADRSIHDFTPTGFMVREITADSIQYYAFTKVSQTDVSATRIFSSSGSFAQYDEFGILREAHDINGNHYIYNRTQNGSSFVTELDPAVSSLPSEKGLVQAVYSLSGSLKKMTLENGEQIFLNAGKIEKVLDSAGEEVTYSYLESQELLSGLQVNRSGTQFKYDAAGFLNRIDTANGVIHRTQADTNGDGQITQEDIIQILLETVDGDKLSDFELDAEGKIIQGIITTQEGIKQRIQNGVLTGFETVDGKVYDMRDTAGGREAVLKEWKMRDGTRVVYGGQNISEIIFPDGKRLHTIGFNSGKEMETVTEELLDGTKKFFQKGKLVKLITPSNSQIYYDGQGFAEKIILADASEERVSYERAADGSIEEIIFTGEHASRVFKADGTLLSLLTEGASAEILNGEVSRLYTRFGEIESPNFGEQEFVSGTIRFSDGASQVIENGVLKETILSSGSHVHYSNGKISAIETVKGRYEIIYNEAGGGLENAFIRLASEEGSPQYPLVPYLLNPLELSMGSFYRDDLYSAGGNIKLDPYGTRFGSSGIRFDGEGDFLELLNGNSTDFQYGSGDFTVDMWIAPENVQNAQKLWSQYTGGGTNNNMSLYISEGKVRSYIEKNGQPWMTPLVSQTTLDAGHWYHIALVRDQNTMKLFINGVMESSASVSGDAPTGNFTVSFGSGTNNSNWLDFFKGSMDEIRISKGAARWTSNFTPSSEEYKRDAHTTRLFHFLTSKDRVPSDRELNLILLGRDAYDVFYENLKISSSLGSAAGDNELLFAKTYEDEQRGTVYEFGADYAPTWDLNIKPDYLNSGSIFRDLSMDISDHQPALSSDLVDINGDGFLDRVFMPDVPNVTYWYVQFNDGNSFQDAVKWYGVEPHFDPVSAYAYTRTHGALKFYEGRHPYNLGTLIDINGDGLPDRVMTKVHASPEWYVQINNGQGFEPVKLFAGNVAPVTVANESIYAMEVWDNTGYKQVQEMTARLIDMDGDALPDRILRPVAPPYDRWFFQKNNGNGFDDTLLWSGLDTSFHTDPKVGGSIVWYKMDDNEIGDLSDLVDMNGDGRPDRLLLKLKDPNNLQSGYDWYIQFNNGSGFDSTVLWDSTVRNVPGVWRESGGTTLRLFDYYSDRGKRSMITDLRDVNGDGLTDRISIDNHLNNPWFSPKTTWWVELNTGAGFADAAAWTGIQGMDMAQTSIGQDDWHRRSFGSPGYGLEPTPSVTGVSDLVDLNGDEILDRVFFTEGQSKWNVQYGTGTGFLTAQSMKVESLTASTEKISSSRYDYLHLSLRAVQNILPAAGVVKIKLGNPAEPESFQEWTLESVSSQWDDIYLPLDKTKENSGKVKIEFIPAAGQNPNIPIYIDNLTFVAMRPDASKDWLDRLLSEESILAEVHSDRNQTLAQYLGLSQASSLVDFNWSELLKAETKISFNEEGETEEFQNLYGSVSKVENGRVVETLMPDGSKIQFEANGQNSSQTFSHTLINSDGTSSAVNLNYDRVRTVSRPGKSPLQYSYEFNSAGEEVTAVYDPDTGIKERYQTVSNTARLISRTHADGVTHEFYYDGKGAHVETKVVYKGRVQETYKHSVSGQGYSAITTDAGVIEEYNAEGKLVFRTMPDGYRYAHTSENARVVHVSSEIETVTFSDGSIFSAEVPIITLEDCSANCEEVHRETLVSYKSPQGDLAGYENRALKNLTLADGTRMSFERFEIIDSAPDAETGEITTEIKLLDAFLYHTDGTILEFRGGIPHAVTSASGLVVSLALDAGYLINPNESAVFHKAQAEKIWNELVKPKWLQFQLPDSLNFQMEYDEDGKLVTRQYAEGIIEIYENGRITMTLGPDGEKLVRYDYDSEGNPTLVQQEGSRRRLTSTVLKVRADIALERQKALARLADRQQVLNQTIEGQYMIARDRLLAIRAQIEAQQNEVTNIKVKGKKAQSTLSDVLQQIQVGLDQVNGALAQLAQERIDALEQLSGQVLEVSTEIESKTNDAYADIAVEELKIRKSVLRQEISPIVYHWYRKIMGRDPSAAEYDFWINSADYESQTFNLGALKQHLQGSGELAARQNEVLAIKNSVQSDLQYYLGLDAAGRQAFAVTVGIDPEHLVELNEEEGSSILTWLLSRSLHFGQSAFISLEILLSGAGLTFQRVELARKLILIDILTGVITPLEKGELLLSTYAMRKTAESYGLQVSPMALNYAGLKAFYNDACPSGNPCAFRMIAHIDGNHYIVITKVTDTEVTFTDPGAGPESALQVQTLSKADFLEAWKSPKLNDGWGYVISARPPPAGLSGENYQVLSNSSQMSVRGAFFGFFKSIFKIFAYAFLIVMSTPLYIASLIVEDLRMSIKNYIDAVGTFFGDLFTFDYKNAFTKDIKSVFKAHLKLGKQLLNLPTELLGRGLRAIGISEKATQTIIAGIKIVVGVVLLFVPGGQAFGVGLIMGGTNELLNLHTNLSPTVKNIISITAAAVALFAGSGFDAGSLSGAVSGLKSQLPYLAKEFAAAGVVGIGNAIGLDPRISSLISIPISAGVGVGTESILRADNFNKASLFAAVKNGFAAGSESIGFNFGGQIGNSLFGNISVGSITSSIESSIGKEGLFSNILNVVKSAVMIPVNAVSGAVQSALSGARGFNSLIQEKGISGAFESLATSIFSRKTLEAIVRAGSMAGFMGSAAQTSAIFGGQQATEWKFGGTEGSSNLSLFFNAAGALIGKKENNITQSGTFGFSNGKWGLITGTIMAVLAGGDVFAGEVNNGQLMAGSLSGASGVFGTFNAEGGNVAIEIDGREPSFGNSGSFWSGVLKIFDAGGSFVEMMFKNGKLEKAEASEAPANNSGVSERLDKELYVLVNGIGNTNGYSSPAYMRDYADDVAEASQARIYVPQDVIQAPTFFARSLLASILSPYVGNSVATSVVQKTQNVWQILLNQYHGLGDLFEENDVRNGIENFFREKGPSNRLREMVGIGYSGGIVPLIAVLKEGAYNVKNLVALGGATFDMGATIADAIASTLETVESSIITGRNDDTRNAIVGLADTLSKWIRSKGATVEFAAGIANLYLQSLDYFWEHVNKGEIDQAMTELYDKLGDAIPVFLKVGLGSLVGAGAQLFVNVWGSEDKLAKAKISGYREQIAGMSITDRDHELFNVEIEGADHFDYISTLKTARDFDKIKDPLERAEARAKHDRIANFVARLSEKSYDKTELKSFLDEFEANGQADFDFSKNKWTIRLPF